MNSGGNHNLIYHVIFTKAKHHHWLFRWLHKDFQHCYVVRESRGGQYWIVANGTYSHLDLELEPKELFPTIMEWADEGDTILTVKVAIDPLLPTTQLSVISCTDICKRALGIRDWLCWTPYQLYKNIKGNKYGEVIEAWRERSKASS